MVNANNDWLFINDQVRRKYKHLISIVFCCACFVCQALASVRSQGSLLGRMRCALCYGRGLLDVVGLMRTARF